MNNPPLIAIVLLNYNGKSLLEQYLPFLLRTTYSNKTIAVIDNGSSDDSVSFLAKNYPAVRIIELPRNAGYSGGYNEGLKEITADYFMLLNTDIEVTPGFIEPLVAMMMNNPGVGVCQPKILSLEHRDMYEYAGAGGGFMDKYGYTFARGRILDHAEKDEGQYDQDCEIFWASGACFVVRASLFRDLGGFYDYFFMYAEEVDLCWRAGLAGWKIFYCHSSIVYHKETIKFISQSPRRIYYVFRNNFIMLAKNLPLRDQLVVIPVRLFLNIVSAFLFLAKGYFYKFFLVIKSSLAFFKWLFTWKKQRPGNKKRLKYFNTVYKKSILVDYYLKGKKRFRDLDQFK